MAIEQGIMALENFQWLLPNLYVIVFFVLQERRTRISEKLRKLQEFVPNMDKVTFH